MAKLPKAIGEQDRLRARARELEGLAMETSARVQHAKAAGHAARAGLVTASAVTLKGGPDQEAEACEHLREELAELDAAERHQRALPEALRGLRLDSNRLATEHRESAFLPHAREAIGELQRKASAMLPMVDELLGLAEEAARRIDRLRHLDADNGAFTGPRAQPAADLHAIQAALAAVASAGVAWPWSVDPQTGAHITHRERREREQAEALRRRGWTPPDAGQAA